MNCAIQELIIETVALPISTVGLFKSLRDSKIGNGKYILWTVGMMAFVGITSPSFGHAVFRMGITLMGSILSVITDNFLGNIAMLIVVSVVLHRLLFTDLEEKHALNLVHFLESLVKRKEEEERLKREEADKAFDRRVKMSHYRHQGEVRFASGEIRRLENILDEYSPHLAQTRYEESPGDHVAFD